MAERMTKAEMLDGETDVSRARVQTGRSTIRLWFADGREVVKYHQTHVVTRYPDGKIVLNSGGYRTLTTKDRINEELMGERIHIDQEKGVWKVNLRAKWQDGKFIEEGRFLSEFYDGIAIDTQGNLLSEKYGHDQKAASAMLKKITRYVNGITEETIRMPSSGDCWYCSLRQVGTGKPLGDLGFGGPQHDHLLSHMEESYYPGALLLNALAEAGYNNPGFILHGKYEDLIRRAVRRYLKKRLLPELAA